MVSISVRCVKNYNLQIAQYSYYKPETEEVSRVKISRSMPGS